MRHNSEESEALLDMRIAQLTTTSEGGAGIAAVRLSKALNEVGVTSEIVSQRGLQEETSLRSKLTTVLQRNLLQSTSNLMTTYSQTTLKKVKVRDFDILHFHAFYNLTRSRDIDKIAKGRPIFLSLHDQRFLTGGCHFSGSCKNYEKSCQECPQAHKAFWRSVELEKKNIDYLLNGPRVHIISPSSWLADITESILKSKAKIHIVRNPIPEMNKFDKSLVREDYQIPSTKYVIGFVSVHLDNKLKGLSDLEKAIKLLPKVIQDKIHLLLICKSGLTSNIGVESRSVIVNPADELRLKLYQLMDVLAVPSRQDNSPNVIGEALMSGTRVIGSKAGGIPELLHDFDCPVVSTTNADVFAKSIIEEMSVKQSRLEISEKAIKIFGYHEIGNKVKKLYEESL